MKNKNDWVETLLMIGFLSSVAWAVIPGTAVHIEAVLAQHFSGQVVKAGFATIAVILLGIILLRRRGQVE